jgi:hypothetical protein
MGTELSAITGQVQQAWLRFTFPSKGIFYGEALPGGEAHVRRMTSHEEAIMQSAGMDVMDRINTVVNNCLRLPKEFGYTIPGTDISYSGPEGLLLTDRLFLLLYQRSLTYGDRYTFPFQCRSCGRLTRGETNIMRDLDANTPEDVLAANKDKEGFTNVEPFPVELPDSGCVAMCRFLRGKDEGGILKRTKRARMQSTDVSDPSHLTRLASIIVAVNKVPEWAQWNSFRRELWLSELPAGDSARIRIATDDRETGVDLRLSVACRLCGAENELAMPFDVEFFQPSRL